MVGLGLDVPALLLIARTTGTLIVKQGAAILPGSFGQTMPFAPSLLRAQEKLSRYDKAVTM